MAFDTQFVAVSDGAISAFDGTDWGIAESSDGDTWTAVWCNGLDDLRNNDNEALSYWVAVTLAGFYYSRANDGVNWTPVVGGGLDPLNAVSYGGASVWMMAGDDGYMIAHGDVTNTTDFQVADSNQFEWTAVISPSYSVTFKTTFNDVRVRKWNDVCTWYACGDSGEVWRTTDPEGLVDWEKTYQDEDFRTWSTIEIDPNDGTVLVGGASNGLIFSEDDGDSWTQVDGDLTTFPSNFAFNDISYSADLGRWVGAGGTRAYVSTDLTSGVISQVNMPGNVQHRTVTWNDGEGFPGARFALGGIDRRMTESTNGTSFVQIEPPSAAGGGLGIASYRLRDECGACPPHDEAGAVGIEKIARASGSKSGGKTQGKGLSMLTEHTDTMWCRDRGTLTDSASTARAIEG